VSTVARLWDLVAHGVRDGSTLYLPRQQEQQVSLAELLGRAERTSGQILAGLAGRRPRRIGLLMNNGEPWVRALLAVLRIDAVVVPLPLPIAFAGFDAYAAHLARIASDAELDAVLVDRSFGAQTAARVDGAVNQGRRAPGRAAVIDVTWSADAPPPAVTLPGPDAGKDAVAVIQYTSGSTSAPKGVVLTHDNVAASLAAMTGLTAWTEQDTVGLWLPLFHDMGLFSLLCAIVGGGSVCLWRPGDFVRRPMAWLAEFAAARVTGLPAPNFCYDYLVDSARRDGIPAGLDLSAWRFAITGAEPVQLRTTAAFTRAFAPCGLRPNLIHPAYGLAEATLMVTMPALNSPVRHVRADRGSLGAGDRVRVISGQDRHQAHGLLARTVVSCGRPVPGMAIRVAGPLDTPCPDGTVGEIQISGPSVTSGYLNVPDSAQPVTPDGWLRTGDLAFMLNGEVYVVGRLKDMIIIRGQNYYPEDVEEVVRTTPGADRRTCVALAWPDDGTERMVVLWETRLDPPSAAAVAAQMRQRVRDQLGTGAVDIVPVAPSAIPHTTSGKVRRTAALRLCREGSLSISDGNPAIAAERTSR
jgi:fatty-acyl-CoA synthase